MHNECVANNFRLRRSVFGVIFLTIILIIVVINEPAPIDNQPTSAPISETPEIKGSRLASEVLDSLKIKGRAPKTDYSRQQFGDGWQEINGCDVRNIILHRDMPGSAVDDSCNVTSGVLHDPYTGKVIQFKRGSTTSSEVQIDHVVALSDAWQKGAQNLSADLRVQLANDPLELLAVDGQANQQKSDGDAATWLPSNKAFRCEYVARQVAVKSKYDLWVSRAEYDVIHKILTDCPNQTVQNLIN